MNTKQQFDEAIKICRDLYVKKLKDYGASWRLLRPESITDQIFIKARRIRTLETVGDARVDEGILPEFIGIANYGIIALIQVKLGNTLKVDITNEQAIELYDELMGQTRELMLAKNHDYDEAWRFMRISSYTDFILTKVMRNKEIEDNNGATLVSEGVEGNYMDMVNYALFGVIKLHFGE